MKTTEDARAASSGSTSHPQRCRAASSVTALLGFEGASIAGNGGRKITSGESAIKHHQERGYLQQIHHWQRRRQLHADPRRTRASIERLGFQGSDRKDETGQAIATCANGDVAVGGGYSWKARSQQGFSNAPTSGSTKPASRTPERPLRPMVYFVWNNTSGSGRLKVMVICMTVRVFVYPEGRPRGCGVVGDVVAGPTIGRPGTQSPGSEPTSPGKRAVRAGFLASIPGDRTEPPIGSLIARDRGLGRGDAGDRHPERRAADVVEADLVEEGDAVGVAAVLAADAEARGRSAARGPAHRRPHQLADARRRRSSRRGCGRRSCGAGTRSGSAPRSRRARSRAPSASGRWCRS